MLNKPVGPRNFTVKSGEVIDKVKELVREGNVTKIRVKSDGKVLVDIPVTLGAIGAVVLPQFAALGVLVAVFKRCTIEVVRKEEPDDIVAEPPRTYGEQERSRPYFVNFTRTCPPDFSGGH